MDYSDANFWDLKNLKKQEQCIVADLNRRNKDLHEVREKIQEREAKEVKASPQSQA